MREFYVILDSDTYERFIGREPVFVAYMGALFPDCAFRLGNGHSVDTDEDMPIMAIVPYFGSASDLQTKALPQRDPVETAAMMRAVTAFLDGSAGKVN